MKGKANFQSRARGAFGPAPRKSRDYAWATVGGAVVEPWRQALIRWGQTRRGIQQCVAAGAQLLKYVLAHGERAGTPADHCALNSPWGTRLADWLARNSKSIQARIDIHRFFEWLIEDVRASGDVGESLGNPLPRPVAPPRVSETARSALPVYYIRKMLETLTSDNWAWARRAGSDDQVEVVDRTTGQRAMVWSPVRASALAVMLLLPLRGFQVRVLDSGEGDSEVYAKGIWSKNAGPHAPTGRATRRQGFLRRFPARGTHRELTGFFVNTNKTAWRLPGQHDPGYEIPWEHAEVVRIVDELRAWQERYNPVGGPRRWADVELDIGGPTGSARAGDVFFLFRDPRNLDRGLPVLYGAVLTLWNRLVREVERTLNDDGARSIDGSALRLTEKRGSATVSAFNLHSLRVSQLTSLLTEGRVPLHILSKHVAGHASMTMTLHYVKTSTEQVSDVLTEASMKVVSEQQKSYARYLSQGTPAADTFVANDGAGVDAIRTGNAGVWTVTPTGICPVGEQCHIGGPKTGARTFAPVPGGRLNCPACRFHVTGPAFLVGLVARFNATSLSFEGAKQELAAAEQALLEAEQRQLARQKAKLADVGHDVPQAQDRVQTATVRLENALFSLSTTYDLIERCQAAAAAANGLSLVLNGPEADIKAEIVEGSQAQLWDAVCQGATFYRSPELNEAVLGRAQALDRMLTQFGVAPLFFNLDKEQSLAAGNEMLRLMALQHGREKTMAFLDGRISDIDRTRLIGLLESFVEAQGSKQLPLAKAG